LLCDVIHMGNVHQHMNSWRTYDFPCIACNDSDKSGLNRTYCSRATKVYANKHLLILPHFKTKDCSGLF